MATSEIPTGAEKSISAHLRKFLAQNLAQDWKAFDPRAATVLVTALVVCLGTGFILGSPQLSAAATTGALPTGFGAYQRLSRFRGAPMMLASIGMGACGFVGAALSGSLPGSAAVGGLIAMVCGLATRFGQAPWWFTLQWAIAFLLASVTPSDLPDAIERGLLVFAGSALQVLIIRVGWWWHPFGAGGPGHPAAITDFIRHRPDFRYATGAGLMVAVGIWFERHFGVANGYWVPMTALIILKPRVHETFARTLQRLTGTLLGGAVATLIAAILKPGTEAISIAIVLLAWGTYGLQRVSYAAFSFGITATVVFLLALTGLPEPEAAGRRILATLVGAALAIIAGALIGDSDLPADRPGAR